MSTKIYEAYRLPVTQLETLYLVGELAINYGLAKIFDRVREAIEKDLAGGATIPILEEWHQKSEEKDKPFSEWLESDQERLKWRAAVWTVSLASSNPYRTAADCNAAFRIHLEGEWAYVIPFAPCMEKDYFMEEARVSGLDLVDFAYWNNTDPDEEVKEEEWEHREETWERILGEEKRRVAVMSFYDFSDPLNHNLESFVDGYLEKESWYDRERDRWGTILTASDAIRSSRSSLLSQK